MANTDAPFGLKPVRYRSGAPYNGASTRYYIGTGDANNLFIGDVVALSGSGAADGTPGIVRATAGGGSSAGDGPLGVVVGFENLTSDNLSRTYRPASTAMYVHVADDPSLEFIAQEDSDSATLDQDDIGLNINFVQGAGDTATGTSRVELNSDTAASTETLDFRIVGLWKSPSNEIGANAIWRVMLNATPLTEKEGE